MGEKTNTASGPLVCVDFDGVLFKSASILSGFPELARIDRSRFLDLLGEYRQSAKSEFLPEAFTAFLAAKGVINDTERITLNGRFHDIQARAAELVFEDAAPFLAGLPRDMLAILSRAHPDWQLPNVVNAGLGERVGRVFIVQGDTGKREKILELLAQHRPVILVDDQPSEINAVAGIPGVKTVFINRGLVPGTTGGCKNLVEALDTVKTLIREV